MNDAIKHPMPTRHPATQEGCSHWASVVPAVTDDPDKGTEETTMPDAAESVGPSAKTAPD